MKKSITILTLLVCTILSFKTFSQTAQGGDAAYYKAIIDAKNFAFAPTYVIPLTGSSQPLTGGIALTYNGTELSVTLPYIGQSYNAGPNNTSNSLIQFKSTTVEYKATEKKNGKMELIFRPKNLVPSGTNDPTQLTLSVSPDGTASLRIISSNRQPISYTGNILRATL